MAHFERVGAGVRVLLHDGQRPRHDAVARPRHDRALWHGAGGDRLCVVEAIVWCRWWSAVADDVRILSLFAGPFGAGNVGPGRDALVYCGARRVLDRVASREFAERDVGWNSARGLVRFENVGGRHPAGNGAVVSSPAIRGPAADSGLEKNAVSHCRPWKIAGDAEWGRRRASIDCVVRDLGQLRVPLLDVP